MTERLYYDDPGQLSFDACVVAVREVDERKQVALDRTAFYPTSGGQPFDTGSLTGDGCSLQVIDVIDDDHGEIWHVLGPGPPFAPGMRLHGNVDAERRIDHRQQHTGQHLLSAVLWEKYKFATVSFHLGAQSSSIDIDAPMFTREQAQDATVAANAIISEARPVLIRYSTTDEAFALGARKVAPGRDRVRLIQIEGVEVNACGGTHVNSTAEIGCLLLRNLEKVKQGMRIEFVCGGRALRTAMRDYEELRRAGGLLSTSVWDIGQQIEKQIAETKSLAKSLTLQQSEIAALMAQQMAAGSDGVVRQLFPDRDAAFIKQLAQNIVRSAGAQTVVLFATAQPSPALLFARTEHSAIAALNMSEILKLVMAEYAGRGGGSATLAQGGIADAGQLGAALDRAAELVQRASTTG